jgi:hypothetical protein
MYGDEEVLVGKSKGRSPQEDLDMDSRIILKWILERGWGDMDRIHVAQDRDQWSVLVSTIMNLRVP